MLKLKSKSSSQHGVTLIELMVAMVLSIVVIGGMVTLMGNSLGSSNRTILMTRLTQELRASMNTVSRDVRRAGYWPDIIDCFGQGACAGAQAFVAIQLTDQDADGNDDCIRVAYDRDGDAALGGVPAEVVFYRHNVVSGVGSIQIKTAGAAVDTTCSQGGWTDLTDPDTVNITALTFDNANTYNTPVSVSATGGVSLIRTREININMQGNLIARTDIAREIEEDIRVRNDFYFPAP